MHDTKIHVPCCLCEGGAQPLYVCSLCAMDIPGDDLTWDDVARHLVRRVFNGVLAEGDQGDAL